MVTRQQHRQRQARRQAEEEAALAHQIVAPLPSNLSPQEELIALNIRAVAAANINANNAKVANRAVPRRGGNSKPATQYVIWILFWTMSLMSTI